jgi:archaetidylinositol phosphate synthase
MATSSRHASVRAAAGAAKDRPAPEVVVVAFLGPLARLLVRALVPLRMPPPAVVLANVAAGLGAAAAIGAGSLVAAAVLLQLKTVLDNADGLLARASGRETLLGRYLDTEADLLVNAAVFAALGAYTDEWWLALGALLAVTTQLSVGFNLAQLNREAHGSPAEPPVGTGSTVERALEGVYRILYAPHDRLLRSVSRRRLARLLAASEDRAARRRAELAYYDRLTLSYLANTGLSTQLLVLGVFLAVGVPTAYLWLALAALVPLPLLHARRERLARSALRGAA